MTTPTSEIPLGGFSKDYNSKKATGSVTNMRLTMNNEGDFQEASRTEGLATWLGFGTSPIRSNFILLSGFVYFVAGSSLMRVEKNKTITTLGAVGGTGRAVVMADTLPVPNVLVLNGAGEGYVYNTAPAGTFAQIVAAEFLLRKPKKGTYLNGRFWLVDTVNNTFFGSALNDPLTYPSVAVATASEHPDKIQNLVSKRSAIHVIKEGNTEYWQAFDDSDLPLRKVNGATVHYGTRSPDSVADLDGFYALLSEDNAIRLFEGTNDKKISNLDIEKRIAGDGSLRFPGFADADNSFGFWIDSAFHKTYCITFQSDKATWCYDLVTGQSHFRDSQTGSEFNGFWRVTSTINAFGITLAADFENGVLWELSPKYKTEGDEALTAIIQSNSISNQQNFSIPRYEVDMETGVSVLGGDEALLQPRVSKDGGKTFVNQRAIPLGALGDYRKRVSGPQVGRVVRYSDLVFQFRCSAPVDITMYGLYAAIEESIF